MARGDLSVVINSETKAFRQGVEAGIIEPLEDAEKALEDLGKTKGPEQLERGMKDAQDQTERLGKETKQVADAIERDFRDSYKSVERSTDGARRGVEDLKSEAQQTGREAAASFKEPADALDALQELSANAFAGFGPAGMAAGLLGAAGIGLVTAEVLKQQEEAQRLQEYFAGAYRSAVEEGRKYIDQATIQKEAQDLIFNPERAGEYKRLQEDALRIGLDANTLILAQVGDQESLNAVLERTTQVRAEEKAAAEEAGSTAIRLNTVEANELERIKGRYEDIAGMHATNADNATRAQAIKDQLHEREREQIQKGADLLRGLPTETRSRLVIEVDDTAVRNYRAPVIRVPGRVEIYRSGSQLLQ